MQKINIKDILRLQHNSNSIRPLHIILGNKNLEKLGEIVNIPADTITYHPQFNSVDELSFTVYKNRNGKIENLWNNIVDFKTVYVKEYDEWFEITVNIDESETNTKKLVTAKSLCEAELSQIILHDFEINTEIDISRDEYTESTILYDPDNPERSLLHRVLDKAPQYTIAYVDDTIKSIQRSFSIDGTSIYDFLTNSLSQEIGCVFLFNTNTREIYVYDMETCCLECGYRSEDEFDVCPECGNNIIHNAYGKNTSIFIDKYNLGNDITLTSDTDSVKNCFRVIGGDDLINATVRNINPNGSNYIYYFNEDFLNDMPQELVEKINSYNKLYDEYVYNKTFSLEESLVNNYNNIISYIKKYYPDNDVKNINKEYVGWYNISSVYYDVIDLNSYLNNSMMPSWKISDKTAETQLALLTSNNLSPVAVTDVSKISVYTANNAVLAMAKALIDTSIYKVEIIESTLASQTWKGKFRVKSYSDDEDIAENSSLITVQINDDYIAYVNQRIDKVMSKVNDQGLKEIYDIEEDEDFKEELHKYSATRLSSYESAFQSAIDILIEQGVGNTSSDLYESIYLPYYNRLKYIQSELSFRNSQLDTITGLRLYIEELIENVHDNMDFQKYLGNELWKLFSSYRREDDYSNDNYISDGLTNVELIQKTNELMTVAKKELVKSGEKQFAISGTLQNLLLLIDKKGNRIFEPILDDFTLGNFIKCSIDGKLYSMRLADISINYGDLSKLNCTFTDAYKYGNPSVNIVKDILTKTQSMATSYSSVKKQASQGEKANFTFEKLQKEGLDSALYNIHNENSTAIFDEHGLLARSYDDVLDDYKDEQSRLTHNELVFTTDNWRTVVTALGKQKYTLNGQTYEEYGLNSNFVISAKIIAGDIYSSNFTKNTSGNVTSGTHFNLNTGDFELGNGKIIFNSDKNILKIKDVEIDWSSSNSPEFSDIEGLEDLEESVKENSAQIKLNSSKIETKVTADDVSSMISQSADEIRLKADKIVWEALYSSMDENGNFVCQNADISGKINATSGTIGGFEISATYLSATASFGNQYCVGLTMLEDDPDAPFNPAIWAGASYDNRYSAPFIVDYAGGVHVKNIEATGGTIGSWNITSNSLYSDYDVYRSYIQTAKSADTWVFSAQEKRDGTYYGNWYVTADGRMYSKNKVVIDSSGKDTGSYIIMETWGTSGDKHQTKTNGLEYRAHNLTNDNYAYLQAGGLWFGNEAEANMRGSINLSSSNLMQTTFDIYRTKNANGVIKAWFTDTEFVMHDGSNDVSIYFDWNGNGKFTGTLYTNDGTVQVSDINLKKNIEVLDKDKASDFIYSLTPTKYKLLNGTSDRYHHGLIAQDVKDKMGDEDWGLYCDVEDIDENNIVTNSYCALRYDELIADLIATVQSQNERIKKLEQKTKQ